MVLAWSGCGTSPAGTDTVGTDGGGTGPSGLGRVCGTCEAGLTCREMSEAFLADGGASVLSLCSKRCQASAECVAKSSAGATVQGQCDAALVHDGTTWCRFEPPVP